MRLGILCLVGCLLSYASVIVVQPQWAGNELGRVVLRWLRDHDLKGLGILFLHTWSRAPRWGIALLCGVGLGVLRRRYYLLDAIFLGISFYALPKILLAMHGMLSIMVRAYSLEKMMQMWAWDALEIPILIGGAVVGARLLRNFAATVTDGAGPSPRCETCGYSLRGLSSNRCPECGTETGHIPGT